MSTNMDDRFGKETNPPKYYLVGKLNRSAFRYLQNPIIAMHCLVHNLSQIIAREAELVDGGAVARRRLLSREGAWQLLLAR